MAGALTGFAGVKRLRGVRPKASRGQRASRGRTVFLVNQKHGPTLLDSAGASVEAARQPSLSLHAHGSDSSHRPLLKYVLGTVRAFHTPDWGQAVVLTLVRSQILSRQERRPCGPLATRTNMPGISAYTCIGPRVPR